VEYSWELVAADPPENMNPVVIVTESSTAYLSVLSPGVYTVQLTVKDLATGLSGSAITTVTVLPASSSPPLVIDVPHTSPNSTTLSQTSPKRPTITANPLPHKSHSQPDKSRIKPTVTTTAKPTSAPSPTPAEAQAFKSSSSSSSDTDYSLYMKVGVPVLSIVLLILTASGCIVGAASCVMFHGQNDKK
jgi:PKD repeat protein